MDKALEEILSRLESHLTAEKASITSEIEAIRSAIEQAEADRTRERRHERFLDALELYDSVVRNINQMRSLGFVPEKLESVIVNGTLQAQLKSRPIE